MADYTLYCFAQSGNAYKAALMLNLCGADWQPRFVDYFNGETRTPAYRAINEMGEVPVLEHARQAPLADRRDPRLSLANLRQIRLGGRGRAARDPALAAVGQPQAHLLHRDPALPDHLHEDRRNAGHRVSARPLERCARHPERPSRRPRFRARRPRPTIADISMCGYLFWPEEIGVSWSDYPQIGAWLERIKALPGWVHPYELMPGHPLPAKA